MLASYTGISSDDWQQTSISLEEYKNEESIRIRFRLQTDYMISDDGWYLDDIGIFEGDPIEFADSGLESAIRNALNKPAGNIYEADLLELDYLDASSYNIQNLSGLEYCVNLQELHLWYNQISDISALAGLTNLQKLDLTNNPNLDTSPGSDNRIIIDDLIDKGCVVYFDEAEKANSPSIEQEKYKKDFMDERIKKNMSKKK